jgi:hypothetical protein
VEGRDGREGVEYLTDLRFGSGRVNDFETTWFNDLL